MTMMLDDLTLILGPYVYVRSVYCWHVSLICSRPQPLNARRASLIQNLVNTTLARVSCLYHQTLVANSAGGFLCSTLSLTLTETALKLSFCPIFIVLSRMAHNI